MLGACFGMKQAARFGPNVENNNRGFMGYSDLRKTEMLILPVSVLCHLKDFCVLVSWWC